MVLRSGIRAGMSTNAVALTEKNSKKLLNLLIIILLIIIYFFGYQSLKFNETSYENIDLLLVQPNIEQKIKWLPSYKESITKKLLNLSNQVNEEDTSFNEKYIIWPETALPTLIDEDDKKFQIQLVPRRL